jgi:hypothetical protein
MGFSAVLICGYQRYQREKELTVSSPVGSGQLAILKPVNVYQRMTLL